MPGEEAEVAEHPDRDEEEAREDVAERGERRGDVRDRLALRQDDPRREGAHRRRGACGLHQRDDPEDDDERGGGERLGPRNADEAVEDPRHDEPGDGDEERYRRFCVGRARGIARALAPGELPAATAIGFPRRTGRFLLYWLAADRPGHPLENPRQVQAWRYPRQYGPQAPGFARALLPASEAMPLLLSGTAAVVGHASRHGDSLQAQLDEVLANLDSLIATARALRPGLPVHPGTGTRLKVYVRDAADLGLIDALLAARLPGVPRIVLHGQVCRAELAVEIDGVHA